ncbi:MAG: AMP-binding protein [Prevotella sp.]|nr:AMP-binding protein [Prevotella sp.]
MIKDFNRIAIVTKEQEVSYEELLRRIRCYADASPIEKGSKVVVLSENRIGWVYAFFSIWANHGIAVPIDASSTISDVAYIINDCSPVCMWVSSACQDLVKNAISEAGLSIDIHIIDEYENIPVENISSESSDWADRDSTAVIIYTSGTTGSPKGVMLSFANIYANLTAVCDDVPIFNSERRTLILLPLHHVLPLVGTLVAPILQGGGIAICPSMSGPDIMEMLCRGKVSIMVGVPRLWQTLYNGIKKKIDSKYITRVLFNLCSKINNRTLSRLVFQSVRKKMGGHITYCVSGGAALDREIGCGLRTLGLDVLEGYGMTETAPMISFTRPDDIIPGCCGKLLPSVTCKVINGEICVKGPNVMQGYYNRPEETADVIDSEGFLHTGDLGRLDEEGRIYITGRTKEIIVLSNGKNVQPAEIEFKLEKFEDKVKEAAVIQKGDMLCAIIVPQEAYSNNLTDIEVEEDLKKSVIQPYNLSVSNYKKIMSVFVYRKELPRTKLDKLKRYKLNALLEEGNSEALEENTNIEDNVTPEFLILRTYIEQEKKMPVKTNSHLETDLAFDSLDRVSLQEFIEQTFGMHLDADAIGEFKNVGAIADYIAQQKTRMDVEETDWHTILVENKHVAPLPSTSLFFPLVGKSFKCFYQIHNSLKVKGRENIPQKGPFIIAPNHQSVLDGPLTLAGVPWNQMSDFYFYATEEHVKHPILKYLARHHNIILMERKNLRTSIVKLAEVLKQGKTVVIFPEGSRTHDGKMIKFKKTFAILSKELNVPIVPVRISGAYEALPRGKRIANMHHIEIEYLTPVIPTPHMSYSDISDEVRNSIECNN